MKINLGCGHRKVEGMLNIDNRIECSPDLVCDLSKTFPFEDNSIEVVRAYDFLEHIPIGKTVFVMEEIYRVLKPNGEFIHFSPSTDGRGAFQDPTHVSFWNVNSFWHFMEDSYRDLYGIKAKFQGLNRNIVTDPINKIVHVYGELYAIK